MAAGDFYIRRNNADTSSVPNEGAGNEDAGWDTLVKDTTDGTGGVFTYSDPNIQLDIGLYLIMYSEHFNTIDTTNNERIEIQGEIHVSGTGAVGGYSQDYIRKSSGQQECIVSGYMILDVTSNNTDVFIRFYRTDNSTTGTVNRVAGYGGVQILQLDATDNYGLYSTSASEQTSGTTARTLNINTNDQQDTGFSRSGAVVTVSNAGRYLMTYSMDLSVSSTSREQAFGWLSRNGTTTPVVGSYSYCYIRGSDGCQNTALTWIGIVDVSASDTFQVRWNCPTGNTTTCAAGATLQMWQIPSGGDECIMEATTGNYNADNADFAWDTMPHNDTASFDATAGNSNIDVNQVCHCLVFATVSQLTDSGVSRAYPILRIKNNGLSSPLDYAVGGGYHRNSSTFGCAITVAAITYNTGSSIEMNTVPLATTGTLANTSGQFSVLNLESIWNYVYPPIITDINTDEQIDVGEAGCDLLGAGFDATQGTGKLELWDDTSGTTKVSQTITSWADGSIEFTNVQGALSEGTVYAVVTKDDGTASDPFQCNLGRTSYDPITSTDADHYWKMNNNYDDDGARQANNSFNNVQRGNYSFQTVPICRSNTHSWYVPDNGGSEPANSNYFNTAVHTYRNIGGWFRTTALQKYPGIIYEEGGGVNNIYILMMPNGRLMANVADSGGTPDFKHQAYSDFALTINRNYYIHLDIEFADHFDLWIDGVKQTSAKAGSLGTDITMSTHSGDWSFGDPGANLDTGGVDISYDACNPMYLAHWATWSGLGGGAPLSDAQIRDELFRDGAIEEHVIGNGTESAMQTTMNAYNNQTHANTTLTYLISSCTAGDFTLDLTNQVWPDEVKFQINYTGTNQLTIRNIGTSNFVTSKAYSKEGGTFAVIETADITITVKDIDTGAAISGATVLIEAGATGPLTEGDEILKAKTDGSGQVSTYIDFTSDQSITGSVRKGSSSTYYKATDIVGTVTSTGFEKTVLMIKDE